MGRWDVWQVEGRHPDRLGCGREAMHHELCRVSLKKDTFPDIKRATIEAQARRKEALKSCAVRDLGRRRLEREPGRADLAPKRPRKFVFQLSQFFYHFPAAASENCGFAPVGRGLVRPSYSVL